MAINFPDNPSDGDIATVGGVTYTYTASSNTWKPPVPGASASTLTDLSISDGTAGQLLTTDGNNNFSFTSIASASSTEIFADMAAIIAKTGMSAGDQGLVLENNKLFMYTGSAWYLIATMINNSPTAITNVDSTYNLAIDGTPTVITAVSTDPEGFPLTWSYAVTSGSLGSTATISQTDNVFTITPSTNSVDAGEFSITFSATDGGSSGIVNKVTSISLAFIVVNSRYTTLLVTATETSDNSNVTDSSTNNHVATVRGDIRSGTSSPYRSGGYSTYFDGSGDILQSPTSADFAFGTGDFTVEFWLLYRGGAGYRFFWNLLPSPVYIGYGLENGTLKPWLWSDGNVAVGNTDITPNVWQHHAVVRQNGVIKIYLDGVEIASESFTTDISSNKLMCIGGNGVNAIQDTNGIYSNFRVIKGTAVYTSNFTPPDEPLTAITNTSLLTCHLPYISDGSINNHTITSYGNVTIQPFSPYDYTEYNPNANGGSVYFPGGGAATFTPTDAGFGFGTGDYTIEGWFNFDDNGAFTGGDGATILSTANQLPGVSAHLWVSASVIKFHSGGADRIVSSTVSTKEWHHIAIVRSSGNTKLYIDGTQEGSTYADSNDYGTTAPFSIGSYHNNGQQGPSEKNMIGYVSDFKVIKGQAIYTSNFTPPAALLSSTGTEIHIKGTDASIIDKSQSDGHLTLFGNTTGSTTQVKFTDSKSMYFDGTGYVKVEDLEMRGDLTIEGWFYQTAATDTTYRALFSASTYSPTAPFTMYSRGGSIHTYLNHTQHIIGGTITQNTWHHVALVRSSGTWTQYVDGVSVATSTIYGTYNFAETTDWTIGSFNYPFTGYVQDFRMTNGLARYTANFTPPTLPLKG